jgi:hypothetical protein
MLNFPQNNPFVESKETKGFIRDASRVGLSSRNIDTMQVNDDGSYDIYFAPTPPEGQESNWIPTSEDYFLLFGLYGP